MTAHKVNGAARMNQGYTALNKVLLGALLLAAPWPGSVVCADVIFSGDFQSGTGQVQFTSDIDFTIENFAFSIAAVVFQNSSSPGDGSFDALTPTGSPTSLSYQLNGTPSSASITNFVDNWAFGAIGDLAGDDDGYFTIADVAAANGDTFTLKAGTYSFTGNPNFSSSYSSLAFQGDVFLANSAFNRVSNVVSAAAVPEPSSFACVGATGVVVLGLNWLRKRRSP